MTTYEAYRKSPYLSIKHNTYFPVYDRIFGRFAGSECTFVEVGVLNGGSLFMWREFFGPRARIIGIDLNPEAVRWQKEGFEIHIGSQSDPAFWADFFSRVGPVDILLDDGGHTYEQQIVTVESALEQIKDGGLLVVEDTHTSYMKEFAGPSAYSFISYAKNRADRINNRFSGLRGSEETDRSLFSVSFYESIVVFEVDRRICGVASQPTSNGGASIGAHDFYRADLKIATMIRARLSVLQENTRSPIMRKIYRFMKKQVYRFSSSLSLRFSNRSLKKFFR